MIKIVQATIDDLEIVKDIAYKTWPVCYGEILSSEQLEYMLHSFYSLESLKQNFIEKNHHFLLVSENETPLGFASYEHHYKGENKTRLHKIYMLPETQGKGIGLKLLHQVEILAKKNHSVIVSLNVNKHNKAQVFYKKNGFKVVAEEVIEIGNDYIMDDFRMEKEL